MRLRSSTLRLARSAWESLCRMGVVAPRLPSKQGACLSSLSTAAPEQSSDVHETHGGQTGLWTAQRSDVDSPTNFVTSQLTL